MHACKGQSCHHVPGQFIIQYYSQFLPSREIVVLPLSFFLEATKALGALVKNLQLLADPSYFGACRLDTAQLEGVLALDKAAFSALHLLPKPGDGIKTPVSLLGYLNKCRTQMGMRLLAAWIAQPLTDTAAIARRHDLVEHFVQDEALRAGLQAKYLNKICDVDKLAGKFLRVLATGKAKNGIRTSDRDDIFKKYFC